MRCSTVKNSLAINNARRRAYPLERRNDSVDAAGVSLNRDWWRFLGHFSARPNVEEVPVACELASEVVDGGDDRATKMIGSAPRVQVRATGDHRIAAEAQRFQQLSFLALEQLRSPLVPLDHAAMMR